MAPPGLDLEAATREMVAAAGPEFEVSQVHVPPWGEWPAGARGCGSNSTGRVGGRRWRARRSR